MNFQKFSKDSLKRKYGSNGFLFAVGLYLIGFSMELSAFNSLEWVDLDIPGMP